MQVKMRIPTIVMILIALCAFYFMSIIIGFLTSFALYNDEYNMKTGCLKSCAECNYHKNATFCRPLSLHSEGIRLLNGEREVESSQKANAFWEDETNNMLY